MDKIYIGNDLVVSVSNLKNIITGSPIAGATVELRMFDHLDVLVTGSVAWPLAVPAVGGSPGSYSATIGYDEINLVRRYIYKIQIDVDDGAGNNARFVKRVFCDEQA